MPDVRWVGLDVHAHESTVAVFDQGTGEVSTKRVIGRPHDLLPLLRAVPRPARVVYEAGPTGYGLARRARAEGIEIVVCAPNRTDRPPSDRLKTDKRDAIRLARALAAGQLAIVTVPSIEREQLRDLVRCREDIRADLMRARHRLGKLLLRREIYYEGPGEPWSLKHRAWLVSLRFADRATQLTIADYLHSHDVLISRRDRVEAELATLAAESRCAATVARLRCLRGIDTLSALGLCAEIGEWERFDHPDQLAAYVGIVPSEHTSGERRRQGSITKAGSTNARWLLIEASYHYRRQPGVGLKLERRQRDQPPEIINIAWRAQRRLNARWRQLKDARRKPNGVVAVADRPRARLLLLGDRHLHHSSGTHSAGIHASGRPPHASLLRPTEAQVNHHQEDQRLALNTRSTSVAAGEAARAPRHRAHQSAACPSATANPGGRARE